MERLIHISKRFKNPKSIYKEFIKKTKAQETEIKEYKYNYNKYTSIDGNEYVIYNSPDDINIF